MNFLSKKSVVLCCMLIVLLSVSFAWTGRDAQAASGYAGKIWKSTASLKKSKSSSSKTLCRIANGKKVTVYSTSGQWRKVKYDNQIGYVKKSNVYISTKAPSLKGKSAKESGKTVASFAQRFKGNPYIYGHSSLNSGSDCSGFVQSVYRAFGYTLPRSSSTQRYAGKKVSKSNMRAGDIVCYSGHVAIYIGNKKIVHASNRKTGIKISSNYNYRKVVSIRRIVK